MRVSIICIGNELLMDDGVGPACARYLLSRYRFPAEVSVLDRACMGMAIISDLREADFALVLDAVDVPGAQPGQVFSFEPEDVAPTPAGMTSLHDVRFADVLGSAGFLGIECRGHCFGIQAQNMSPSEFVRALTPKVAAAVPLLAKSAVRYLRDELGIEVDDLLASDAAQPVLPQVFGEPDVSVMTGYLAAELGRRGFPPQPVHERDDVFLLELGEVKAVERAFGGVFLSKTSQTGTYSVTVLSDATDVDCDAFCDWAAKAAREGADR